MKPTPTEQPVSLTNLVRVTLVEDDPVHRNSLLNLLQHAEDLGVVGVFPSVSEAKQALPQLQPDVALVDISFPGESGIELVRTLKPLLPATQFMMLTVLEDADRVFAALEAGAAGYLLKRDSTERLIASVKEIHAGGSPMSSSIARYFVSSFQRPTPRGVEEQKLSPREREILERLAEGQLYKEIADCLNIGLGTVKTHIRRMYDKLHVRNRTEAVRKAGGR